MRLLSTRDLAEVLGVSESSLKRWVDAGRISASRTEGGHRRIALGEAMRFIRETRAPVVRPELLDLPELAVAAKAERLTGHLLAGDSVGARGFLLARYLGGATIAELADGPIREAMHALGELWHHQDSGIFVEHRGTDVCLEAVAHLRGLAPIHAGARAPLALGGAPAGDPYLLPSQLAAMTLAEAGLRAINLGSDTPPSAFAAAVAEHAPRLVWISVTAALASARARALVRWIDSLPASISVVVGGQQASQLGKLPPRVRRGTTMTELAELGASLARGGRAS
ncbi:MAG: helix-turn-helix domain-containing protein [Deltaproteobacteria bacterium]|nr:helix-turn-helix domain-containing protein [Deltaproteobacteria bacterium]